MPSSPSITAGDTRPGSILWLPPKAEVSPDIALSSLGSSWTPPDGSFDHPVVVLERDDDMVIIYIVRSDL